ncbi:hypothetical protein SAMN06265360_10642 [Haloechinothrix alba]|uniref:Uncharacterized protein n=1 Tax=Haloechinothrix alba TaxID=664784 RepID=A0A238WDJ3_9PSEU|nr:hypothetical protein [Haloechinothrix alba]SNR44344.1 hypothetical protein SAMN06265360_10642 [Haloechinothrix alba]
MAAQNFLGQTVEIDTENQAHLAFAHAAHQTELAEKRLRRALEDVHKEAERALDCLDNGHRVNEFGPVQSESRVTVAAMEYHTHAAYARQLAVVAGIDLKD